MKYNVQFRRCLCQTPQWAMNWRGTDLSKKQYSKWGAFQNLGEVRRSFRGKEQVSKKLKELAERQRAREVFSPPFSAVSSGSKRTRESPGGESRSTQKKQAQGEAIPPPPPTSARDELRRTVQQSVAAVQRELSLQTAAATAAHQAAAPQAPVVALQAVTVADSLAQFQKVFSQFPWTGSLLQYFFVREKENLLRKAGKNRQQTQETLEIIHHHINVLWKSIQRDQRTIDEHVQRDVFDVVQSVIEDSLEIYDATGNKLTKGTDVLKYSFKLLMNQVEGKSDAEKPRNLSMGRRSFRRSLISSRVWMKWKRS